MIKDDIILKRLNNNEKRRNFLISTLIHYPILNNKNKKENLD